MPYESGTSGNLNGRPKGTMNKATATARESITAALAGATTEKLAAQLDTLTGKDYIDAYVKLAEFVAPKLSRATVEVSADTPRPDLSSLTDDELRQLLAITRKIKANQTIS